VFVTNYSVGYYERTVVGAVSLYVKFVETEYDLKILNPHNFTLLHFWILYSHDWGIRFTNGAEDKFLNLRAGIHL